MNRGIVQIYYGEGHGKTTAAIGSALRAASIGQQAYVIQFLKGKNENNITFFKRLEPEVKFFSFSKSNERFSHLEGEVREEEKMNQLNGFHYAKKVITTGACDLVVLDEILGMIDLGLVSAEELVEVLEHRPEELTVILTGRKLDYRFRILADEIYNIDPEK